jgi:hypothetical protein
MVDICIILLLSCAQGVLLGNYKLYDSRGSALYDFSGNRNHAEVSWDAGSSPVLTDRGHYFYSSSQIDFPSNMYKLYPSTSTTMVIAMWLLVTNPGRLFRVSKIENSQVTNCYIDWVENINKKAKVILTSPAGSSEYTTLIKLCNINVDDWNFIVVHFTQGNTSTTVKIYDGADNSFEVSHTFTGFLFASADTMWGIKTTGTGGFQGFLYEIWWRDDISTDISTTFSAIEQARPAVLTKPAQDDPFKTHNSLSCSSTCTNNRNSCSESSSNCLTSCNISCTNGCYNFKSPTCISPRTIYCTTFTTSTNNCARCRNNFTLANSSCACSSTQAMVSIMTISKCLARVANCSKYSYFTEQCTECNTGFFIVCIGTACTKSCVSDCPMGYYKSSTSPVTCIVCRAECSSCTGANTCTACVTSKYLKLASCVDSCGVGYFQDNTTRNCIQCPSNCNTCSYSGGILVCTACNSGYYNKSGVCVLSCGVGYFQDNTTRNCIQCSANCNTCSYLATILVCTACNTGYYMQAGSCVASCSIGYYLNTVSSFCAECPSSCSACNSDTVCIACKSGFALATDGLITSCDSCPVGQYGSNSICYTCPTICTACTSISKCTSCIQDASVSAVSGVCECNLRFADISGSCITAFTASASMNSDGTINLIFSDYLITDLDPALLSFKSGSSTFDSSTFLMSSITPKVSYTITLNEILLTGLNTMRLYFPTDSYILRSSADEILFTEYSDILITAPSITTSCSSISDCTTCSNSGTGFVCDSCRDLSCLYSDPSIKCGECCDAGYYQETVSNINACIKCDPGCHTCSNSSNCLSCTGSLFLLNNDCVTDCGVGKYNNLSNNQCSDCIENCDICSDRNSCTTCKSEFLYNSFINICEPCPEGTYYNNQACEACPDLCRSCSNVESCSECIANASNLGGLCYCDTKYTLINNECIRSPELHATADVNVSGIILLSFDTELLNSLSYNSIVFKIQNISYNYIYFTISEIETHRVYTISLNLKMLGISNLILSFEDPSSIISVESALIQETEIIIYIPVEIRCDSTNICEICPEICIECPNSQCNKCTNSYYLLNSTCISECPSDHVLDTQTQTCIKCEIEGCISCELNLDSRSPVCIECNASSLLVSIGGMIKCIALSDSIELYTEICDECSNQCNEYSGNIACSVCMGDAEVLSSLCSQNSDNIDSITQDVQLVSASLEYIRDKRLRLSFEKPLLNDLTKESISLYKNDNLYNNDKFTIQKEPGQTQKYIITLEDFDIYKDNNVAIEFLNGTFLAYRNTYLSKVSLLILAQSLPDNLETPDDIDDSDDSESQYSDQEQTLSAQTELVSMILSTASTVGAAVSIASGSNNAWSMLSTIQIFSFLPLLQVDMPLMLKSYLKAQESYYPAYDLFHHVIDDNIQPFEKAREFKYRSSNFILNTGKPIFVIITIVMIDLFSSLLRKLSKGNLKVALEKVTKKFRYEVYLRYFIQMYIEFCIPAILQLIYVISI